MTRTSATPPAGTPTASIAPRATLPTSSLPRVRLFVLAMLAASACALVVVVAMPLGCNGVHHRQSSYEERTATTFDDRDDFLHNEFYRPREEVIELIELLRDERASDPFKAELLSNARQSRDYAYKANMLYILAAAGVEDALPDILEALDAERPYSRKEAVRAFGELGLAGDRNRLEPLLGLVEPEPTVREVAQEAYRSTLSQPDFWLILARLEGTDEVVHRFLLSCLDGLYDDREAERLAEYLTTYGPRANAFILERLAGRFERSAFPMLASIYLGEGDPPPPDEVRGVALAEVVRLVTPSDREVRAQLVHDFVSETFAPALIADALMVCGLDDATTPELVAYADTLPIDNARDCPEAGALAVEVLAASGSDDEDVLALMQRAFANENLRENALDVLLAADNLDQDALAETLALGIHDDRARVAKRCVDGLAAIGSEIAIEHLVEAMSSETPTTVEAAARALVEMRANSFDTREDVWKVLESRASRQFHIMWALHYLGELGEEIDIEVIETYTRMLDNPRIAQSKDDAIAKIRARLDQ